MIRVIDIETTGEDPEKDEIVEVASIDLTRNGGYTNVLSSLVKPTVPISVQAMAVHHLIPEDVADAPTIDVAIPQFRGAKAYVAHNAQFEQGFLGKHLGNVQWICTMKCALRVWPDAPKHSNQVLRYWLGLVNPLETNRKAIDPHRALSDVLVTGAILFKLMEKARWSDLIAWSMQPPLYTFLPLGKHKGQRFDQVPASYLDWIVTKSELDEGMKHSARYWLAKGSPAQGSAT